MMKRTIPRLAIAVVLLSCGKLDLTAPGADISLPENHPTATDSAFNNAPPVWSENGAQFAYILPDIRTVVARTIATGLRRTLYQASAPEQIVEVEFSPDASEWFTVALTPGNGNAVVRRHTANATDVVTDRGVINIGNGTHGRIVLEGKNGDIAFIVRPDTLYIRRKSTGLNQFLGTGCAGLGAVSPIGDGVLCYTQQSVTDLIRYTNASTPPTTVIPTDATTRILHAVWNAQGIFLLYIPVTATSAYGFQKFGDPTSRFFTPTYSYPETTGFGLDISLSADGHSFAYANPYCAQSRGVVGCGKNQNLFYIADGLAKTTKRLAVHTSNFSPLGAVSPDGTQIAYIQDSQLFLLSAK